MTEINGMSQSQGVESTPVSSQEGGVNVERDNTARTSESERTFRQSEVNDIVKKVKHEAVEGFKRLRSEQPQYALEKYGESSLSSPRQPESLSEDRIRQLTREETERHIDEIRQDAYQKSQQEMAQRTVQNFYSKTQAGKEKYQDFDAVTGDIQLGRFPNVVQLLADHVENADDVLYELGKDRTKMAMIENLATLSPQDAVKQTQRLAQSLKENIDAKKQRIPNEPLSQMRPSTTGTDSGDMSVSDFRRKYKG